MSNEGPQRPSDPKHASLSELLTSLCEGPAGPISVRDIVDHFGHRAFGAVLFVFAVPNVLPLPPGSSGVLGAPLVLISPQLAIGRPRPWLPRAIADRTVNRSTLNQAFSKVIPSLERVEKLLAPRLGFLFGPVGDRIIGLVCFLLSAVLILPIPGGNILPAAAIAVLSLALTQRDGVFLLFGYTLTGASVGLLIYLASAIAKVFDHLLKAVGV